MRKNMDEEFCLGCLFSFLRSLSPALPFQSLVSYLHLSRLSVMRLFIFTVSFYPGEAEH